jgi:acetolactate synthase I/II/III large subunit
LTEFDSILLLGAEAPVAFFAYPHKSSQLCAPGTRFIKLTHGFLRLVGALQAVRAALGPIPDSKPTQLDLPGLPSGIITPEKLGAFLGNSLPEDTVVVNESITTGRTFFNATQHARTHD